MKDFEERKVNDEDEIDLIALVQKLWAGRKTVIKFLVIFGIIGLFVAIFSPKEYTATTMIVPTSEGKSGGGSLGGLAALAGINLGGGGSQGSISPSLYPQVVKSIPFKRQLLETPLTIEGVKGQVTFRKYYEEIYTPSVLSLVKKYTIGLPGIILGWIRGTNDVVEVKQKEGGIIRISSKEYKLMKLLDGLLSLNVNDKEGYVTLKASMPEALPSAQMAEKAQQLLQKYIIDFKSQKATEQLKFIEERFKEKEKEFRKAELALARFQDRNRNVSTAVARTEEKRLSAEYNLLYSVYSELAKRVETQKIQVKEDTPAFSIIEPVSVPVEKSKPKRAMILIIWLFLGGVLGVGVVFGRDFIQNIKNKQ